MIGSGLKKFAKENGMKVASGVAYGSLRGYAATLSEGSGFKQIVFATKFADPENVQQLQDLINQTNITREYRVQNLTFASNGIQVIFADGIGTMKKISAFVDWFIPLLGQYSASAADICPECGGQVVAGSWKLVDGIACYMHESCAQKVRENVTIKNEIRKQEATGSYGMGLVGALGGSLIGSIVWAIVLNLGYVASLVGLVIGWLAEKGYNLLKGKQGKGKIAILIVAIIIGVLVGTIAADAFTLMDMINNKEINLEYGEILPMIFYMFSEDEAYSSAVVSNIFMGLLFAGLGVFALLRKAGKEVADTKFVDLP